MSRMDIETAPEIKALLQGINNLPAGAWRFTHMSNGDVIAACPDHPPHLIKPDGTVEKVEPKLEAKP